MANQSKVHADQEASRAREAISGLRNAVEGELICEGKEARRAFDSALDAEKSKVERLSRMLDEEKVRQIGLELGLGLGLMRSLTRKRYVR